MRLSLRRIFGDLGAQRGRPRSRRRKGRLTIERAELRSPLTSNASSPAAARRIVRTALSDWDLGELEPVATLLVTELVANVVLHTESTSELTMRFEGERLYVGVGDADPRPPVRRRRSPTAATGRGLALVEELAVAWGYTPADEGDGKVVWFELDVERGHTGSLVDTQVAAGAGGASRGTHHPGSS